VRPKGIEQGAFSRGGDGSTDSNDGKGASRKPARRGSLRKGKPRRGIKTEKKLTVASSQAQNFKRPESDSLWGVPGRMGEEGERGPRGPF